MIDYMVDARKWPDRLALLFSMPDLAADWTAMSRVPASVAEAVLVDHDRQSRCCGLEIFDAELVVRWNRAGESAPTYSPRTLLLPDQVTARDADRLNRWAQGIVCYAGAADPHVSLHWNSGRAYAYSADLDELKEEGVSLLDLGLTRSGKIVGVSFRMPTENVRGLQRRWWERDG